MSNEIDYLDSNLKKRFCKDFKIPINVYQEPYFSYFVELYDSFFSVKQKLNFLNEAINFAGGKEEFFLLGENLSTKIKEEIRNSNAYNNLMKIDFNKDFLLTSKVKGQNIYIVPNVDKELISIDLNQANFNCLNFFGLNKELEVNSYNDLLKKYSDLDYYLNSKMFRQIIFGDLNPQKQQRFQKYIIDIMCTKLQKEGLILSSASSDEIIVSNAVEVKEVYDILSDLPEEFKFFRVENFIFNKISDDHEFFIKTTYTDKGEKLEFKNVPSHLFSQVFKRHFNLPLNDNDMLFYHEGFLAQFKEPLFNNDLKQQKKLKF